jgi:hypothetical protein
MAGTRGLDRPGKSDGKVEPGIMRITVKVVGSASANSQARFQAGDIIRSKNNNAIGIVLAANYLSESEIGLRKVVYEIIDANGTIWKEFPRDIELL